MIFSDFISGSDNSSLGTIEYYIKLTKLLATKSNESWNKPNIAVYFNTMGDGLRYQTMFGSYDLALSIGLINIKDEKIIAGQNFIDCINEKNKFKALFATHLFKTFSKDSTFIKTIKLRYEINHKVFVFLNDAFSAIRHKKVEDLFRELDLIIDLPKLQRAKALNPEYEPLISKYSKEISPPHVSDKTPEDITKEELLGLDLETFRKLQKAREEYGEIGETYVIEFEKKRLKHDGHIKQVSKFNVGAGYDIASFNLKPTKDTDKHDRYIEVKSYKDERSRRFYWSKNEIKTAKRFGNEYFIYLVNRSCIHNDQYEPEIIKNPYNNIFKNKEWIKDCQNYLFIPTERL